jgi:hypothetical protein
MFAITKDYTFTKLLGENLKRRYELKKRMDGEPIHVSDLVPSAYSCLRKQYYDRKFPLETQFQMNWSMLSSAAKVASM